MSELEPGVAAEGTYQTRDLLVRLAWLYLAGVFGLLTLAYEAVIGVATMFPGRPSPLWHYVLAFGLGLIGVVATWFAGKTFLRACRRGNTPPVAFGLRWLGAPIALAAVIGVAFFFRARAVS